MAAIINFGTSLGEAVEIARAHRLAPEARDWLLRRVYRDSACRADLQSPFNFDHGIADRWMLALQWEWISSLPPGERERMHALQETSERYVATAVERGEPLVWCAPLQELQLVADWLASLPAEAPDLLRKLDRVSWNEAVTLTERWHAGLARRMSRKASAAGLAQGTRTVLELSEGWSWVRLETEEALDREGEAMGHCVGSGGCDGLIHEAEPDGIYSLRDTKGMPHVTVEVREWEACQAQGKGNSVPEGHSIRLRGLLNTLGVGLAKTVAPGPFGLARVKDQLVAFEEAVAGRPMDVEKRALRHPRAARQVAAIPGPDPATLRGSPVRRDLGSGKPLPAPLFLVVEIIDHEVAS